jgi:futalosine hydrolase
MKLLILAATSFECRDLALELGLEPRGRSAWEGTALGHQIWLQISGIGMVNTAFFCGKLLERKKYEAALNIGVAGAYDRNLDIGEVVEVLEDSFPEMGAESEAGNLTLEDLGFPALETTNHVYFNTFRNPRPWLTHWPGVTALTVNRVHGRASTIAETEEIWGKQIESMEGAAFFQSCLAQRIPFWALRAISNYVEPRNLENWHLKTAARNVQTAAVSMLGQLSR